MVNPFQKVTAREGAGVHTEFFGKDKRLDLIRAVAANIAVLATIVFIVGAAKHQNLTALIGGATLIGSVALVALVHYKLKPRLREEYQYHHNLQEYVAQFGNAEEAIPLLSMSTE